MESRRLLAATPVLVGDINKTTDMLAPGAAVQAGKYAYFAGRPNAADGPELFRTDGTRAGTVLVKNINPNGGSGPQNLAAVNGVLYFSADDGVHGRELWRSDGTAAGTRMVADLNQGKANSNPASITPYFNNSFRFSAYTSRGNLVFRSDGTASGTYDLYDYATMTSPQRPSDFTPAGDLFVLANANTSTNANTLYRLVDSQTERVAGVPDGLGDLSALGRVLYFSHPVYAASGSADELWLRGNDGVIGTVRLKVFANAAIRNLTPSGDRMYFLLKDYTTNQTDLWRTDGTTAGTIRLTTSGTVIDIVSAVGTRGLIYTDTAATTGRELYATDGTTAGTKLLKDLTPGTQSGARARYVGGMAKLANGRLLFTAAREISVGTGVWTTDGTAAGTKLVTTINDALLLGFARGTLNGVALIQSIGSNSEGDLFRSDGTASGTYRVGTGLGVNASSLSRLTQSTPQFVAAGNAVFFVANDGKTGSELYKSTNGGTPVRVTDLAPYSGDPGISALTATSDGALYFQATADPAVFDRGIYRVAPGGTTAKLVVPPSAAGGIRIAAAFATLGGALFFHGLGGPDYSAPQLWKYDPATGKTTLMINAGESAEFTRFVKAGNTLYIGIDRVTPAATTAESQELYKITSPTAALTRVTTVVSSKYATQGFDLVGAAGTTLYFQASTPTSTNALHKSDGTAAGTKLISGFPALSTAYVNLRGPEPTLAVGNTLYFSIAAADQGIPYRSDGTATGTQRITGVDSGANFVTAGGKVYFIGKAGAAAAAAVYRVDGTVATRVSPIKTGDAAFTPTALKAAGNKIFVVGVGGANVRYELWQADAAFAGFAKVTTLAPYSADFSIPDLVRFNTPNQLLTATATDLYFPMYTAAKGVEPYRISLGTAASGSAMARPWAAGGMPGDADDEFDFA